MAEQLLSVGIDIGTSTTQLIFSGLLVENAAPAFTVPQFAITKKEILYRSPVYFTPLCTQNRIDTEALRQLIDREYAAAGYARSQIQTGAIIITGETARKENARQVLSALSGFAGDFVVATAGPALESVLAGKGAGAQRLSEELDRPVLNIDIGGGTSNLALFDRGALVDTGCLNVGGRLIKLDKDSTLQYVSPVLRPYTDYRIGATFPEEERQNLAGLLAEVLQKALRGEEIPEGFVTDKVLAAPKDALLSFSGGVAALMEQPPEDPLAYGDLGADLAAALLKTELCAGAYRLAAESIRATVIGAGSHATALSGSTIYYAGVSFPMKNLPVAVLRPEERTLPSEALAASIRKKFGLFSEETAVLSLPGGKAPSFLELCQLADGIALGAAPYLQKGRPLLLALESDYGKALGQALQLLLPQRPILCADALHLEEGSYLDIGAPLAEGQALPVVIKTLALPS